jgi:aminopeptidase N
MLPTGAFLRPRLALALPLIAALAGCAGQPPLDPLTGDTGGPLTANERATDVVAYELTLEVFPEKKALEGTGTMMVRAREAIREVEVQLDPRYDVPRVRVDGKEASFTRERGVIAVALPEPLAAGGEARVSVDYRGKPWVALRAPWDGGFVWSEAPDGSPWIATAVQGEGCDMFWPCKDHFADKPERMEMHVTVPAGLSVAFNGRLQSVDEQPDGRRTFHWVVSSPISDYNVSLNIGPFERIETSWESVNGETVPIEFWALPSSEEKARRLIEDDLRHQIEWYERTLGPYPWGDEKLGLVETPHLGMEHQTLNAYGAGFERDDEGFDGLLQHELAHEWFGNLMTHERLNDAWLHEGYGAYMQPAYALDRYGDAFYHHSMYRSYLGLLNCEPVVRADDPTSDEAFNPDIYGKGAWTLHTLRALIGDEAFWRATRRLLYDTEEPWDLPYPIAPRYRSTEEFVAIVNETVGSDLTWFFDVYLREAELPILEVERGRDSLELAWSVPGGRAFPLRVPVRVDGEMHEVAMEGGRGSLAVEPEAHVVVDPEMVVLRRLPIIGDCEEATAARAARRR